MCGYWGEEGYRWGEGGVKRGDEWDEKCGVRIPVSGLELSCYGGW